MADDRRQTSAEDATPANPAAPDRGALGLPRALRHLVRFVLTIVAALLLGTAIEKITEVTARDTQAARAAFARLEADAAAAVAGLRPSTAVRLFGAALTQSPEATAALYHRTAERRAGHPIAPGTLPSDQPERHRSDVERETGVRLGYWANPDGRSQAPTLPITAFVDVVWHLFFSGTIVARVLVLAQFAFGATLMVLVMTWASMRGWDLPGFLPAPLFCIGTAFLASGSAYATGFIITTAQASLGALGDAAGVSVGLGAIGSCCVAFFKESVEMTLHKRLEVMLEKI